MNAHPNKIAAFLYMCLFNIGEGSHEIPDSEAITADIENKLKELKYPTDVVFDNDGWPMINWAYYQNPGEELFDPEKFFEEMVKDYTTKGVLSDEWITKSNLGKAIGMLIDDENRRPLDEVLQFLFPEEKQS